MNKLESFACNVKKTKSEGTKTDKEMDETGKILLKLVDSLYPGKEYEEKRKIFEGLMNEFEDKLKNYQGNFSNYFKYLLKEIKEQERQSLGYHVNSD